MPPDSLYPATSQNDNHRAKAPRQIGIIISGLGNSNAGHRPRRPGTKASLGTKAFLGTRASANTSGPDFTLGFGAGEALEPVKLRISEIRTERRKSFLLPYRFRPRERVESRKRPFDLMSRRHPLSSTRAFRFKTRCWKRIVLKALVTCRHQAAGNFVESEITSSWKPSWSSSQSSSLRSSPSLPS